jgi:toxin ParE1/3/4
LENIKDYVNHKYPKLAQPTIRKVYDGIVSLKTMPYRGRIGREEGTRELVLAPLPYIAVYRVREQDIEVLHIYHGAQEQS